MSGSQASVPPVDQVRRPSAGLTGLPVLPGLAIALPAAVLAGALTSVGQAGGPVLGSLSNSAGPWFVASLLLVLIVRLPLLPAMLLGVVCLELMHVGYWWATTLRGYPDFLSITNFWVLMGVPAGILAGLTATWLRRQHWQRAVAFGLVVAVLVGEGIRGVLQVAATTGTTFWLIEIAAGVVVAALGMVIARTRGDRVLALATAVAGTAAVLGVFLVLDG